MGSIPECGSTAGRRTETSNPQEEVEPCRKGRNRRRHEEAVGSGESRQSAAREGRRRETSEEGGGKEACHGSCTPGAGNRAVESGSAEDTRIAAPRV